MAEKRSTDSQ